MIRMKTNIKPSDVYDLAIAAVAEKYTTDGMRKRADELVAEAERQGAEARKTAENLVANARTEAERIVARARNEAQTLAGQTQAASAEQNRQGDAANDSEEGDGKRRRRRLWGNKES